jgi:hypothetical protein
MACDQINNTNPSLARTGDSLFLRTGISSDSHQLATFHLFPTLPTEIRLKIWRHALPPRIIEIRFRGLPNCVGNSYGSLEPHFTSRIPRPLHVCRESRTEALRHYELNFGLDTSSLMDTNRECAGIYVDFEKDILFFGQAKSYSEWLWCAVPRQVIHKVQNMALRDGCRAEPLRRIDLTLFENLKKLIFVTQPAEQREFDLGKETDLLLFKETDWSRQKSRLEEMGASRDLEFMKGVLKEMDVRPRYETPQARESRNGDDAWEWAEWLGWIEDVERGYNFERDYQGLPGVELRVGTFVTMSGDIG